ncbi:ABC-F family ATP-binding cassette domain-containing protein [Sphingomonas jatrophae]|uniref:ATPase components of ABC transporters with duplicated ATPase domains n=1 Tax=Sphingomonas jatrophae TaxID=1166337 RepID=A0A1I6KZ17_9SPHN|nr:ABC-F family ATP-binding cassette domain-containing protein [Sphingomonas jatrophae]SFR96476.1 ATPase components of ABC transporters with duplicated ATPase domains [Sphingomonas jatrophae]
MSSFLTFSGVSAATPDGRTLFHDLTLSVGVERIGLVGRNGSGKSTLLHIAAGIAAPAGGSVRHTGSVGMLVQHWHDADSVAEALGVAERLAILERIEAGDGTTDDFDDADWALPGTLAAALAEVGLDGMDVDRRIASLSGGERTRIGIARLAIEQPDLLLLDEPTNNLDRAGRAAIEALVAGWRGGLLVASHDRALLEQMDRIVELSPVEIRIVGGGWSAFADVRDAERARAEAERDRADAALRSTRIAAQAAREAKDRRDKAGRMFAAKGSEPKILLGARAERAENSGGHARRLAERQIGDAASARDQAHARIEVLTPLTIDLPRVGLPSDAEVLALNEVTARRGDRRLGPWTFAIRGPERVAITGPNGAGKSTLLHLANDDLLPAAGTIRRRSGQIAMLDQHVGLLDPDDTILGNLRRRHPMLGVQDAYAACARFAFRNRDAERMVGSLSGGERLRAGLAAALSGPQPPWLLILDEPTNHLDVESIEVLERALRTFDGALLVVSHDTRFLEAIGIERTFAMGENG